jgi:hypothetical protein
MTGHNQQAEWTQSAWLQEVKDWVQAQGIQTSGEIENIHQRPWSCILKIPSTMGNLFFKATAGLAAHEIALTDFLSKLMPNHSPKLVAVNSERAWMIMEDGGQRLRESLIQQADWAHWESLLPQFAKLQQEAAKVSGEIYALGLPNRNLEQFPRLYESMLSETDWFRVDLEDGLSAAELQKLHDLIKVVQEKSDALSGYAIPESIHHGDLHDANIFHNKGMYRFFDWGDSSFSHPFFSLRTSYVSAEMRFGLDEGSPELHRLRNAYLAAWRDYDTEANLLAAFGLAEELWSISSMLIWRQSVLSSAPDERKDYAHVIPSLSKEFLSLIKA